MPRARARVKTPPSWAPGSIFEAPRRRLATSAAVTPSHRAGERAQTRVYTRTAFLQLCVCFICARARAPCAGGCGGQRRQRTQKRAAASPFFFLSPPPPPPPPATSARARPAQRGVWVCVRAHIFDNEATRRALAARRPLDPRRRRVAQPPTRWCCCCVAERGAAPRAHRRLLRLMCAHARATKSGALTLSLSRALAASGESAL